MYSYNFEASNSGMIGYETFVNTPAVRSIEEFVHSSIINKFHLTFSNYLYDGRILNLRLLTCILINSVIKNIYNVDKKGSKYKQDHIKVLLNNRVMKLSDLTYNFEKNVTMKDLIFWYSNGYIEMGFITEILIHVNEQEKIYYALLILDKHFKISIALLESFDKARDLFKETFKRKSGQIYLMIDQVDPYILNSYININIEKHNVYTKHFEKYSSRYKNIK